MEGDLVMRVQTSTIKGQLPVLCPAYSCSDRSQNMACYNNFDTCPFYQAYQRAAEVQVAQSREFKRGFQL